MEAHEDEEKRLFAKDAFRLPFFGKSMNLSNFFMHESKSANEMFPFKYTKVKIEKQRVYKTPKRGKTFLLV